MARVELLRVLPCVLIPGWSVKNCNHLETDRVGVGRQASSLLLRPPSLHFSLILWTSSWHVLEQVSWGGFPRSALGQ